jgi:hypothetical protein
LFGSRCSVRIGGRSARSLDELAGIHGLGAVKLEKYGPAFLAVMQEPGGSEAPDANA